MIRGRAVSLWLMAACVVILVWGVILAFMPNPQTTLPSSGVLRIPGQPPFLGSVPAAATASTACRAFTDIGVAYMDRQTGRVYVCTEIQRNEFDWQLLKEGKDPCPPQTGFYSAESARAGRPVEVWEGPTGRQWLVTHHGPPGSAPKDYPALLDIVQVPETIHCKLGVVPSNRVSPGDKE